MSDRQERVLETFQITQLHSPKLYDGGVADDVSAEQVDHSCTQSGCQRGLLLSRKIQGSLSATSGYIAMGWPQSAFSLTLLSRAC